MRIFILIATFLLMVGCAVPATKFLETADNLAVPTDKSRVVVYRSLQDSLSNYPIPVLDNGEEMGVLNFGEVGIYDTDPGFHEIYTDATGGKGRKAQISMKPSETYYVKFTVYDNYYVHFASAVFISDEMAEKDALRDLRDLREQSKN